MNEWKKAMERIRNKIRIENKNKKKKLENNRIVAHVQRIFQVSCMEMRWFK
jgi:hypothetical protein